MRKLFAAICVTFMIGLAACSNGEDPVDLTAAELTDQGWNAYAGRDYQSALARFNEALAKDAEYADAYNGLGWTHSQLNDLASSVTHFTNGIARSSTLLDLRAGLGFVYGAQKNYSASVQRALEVIQANPAWVFPRDRSISASDLRLLLAANYFAEGNYAAALAQVVLLNPSFSADVSTVAGQRALGEEIERLRSVV